MPKGNTENASAAIQVLARVSAKPFVYSSQFHILALASVIRRPVFSVYPDIPNIAAIRNVMHGLCYPRRHFTDDESSCSMVPIHLMWTRAARSPLNRWNPNHFTPLVNAQNWQSGTDRDFTSYADAVKQRGKRRMEQFSFIRQRPSEKEPRVNKGQQQHHSKEQQQQSRETGQTTTVKQQQQQAKEDWRATKSQQQPQHETEQTTTVKQQPQQAKEDWHATKRQQQPPRKTEQTTADQQRQKKNEESHVIKRQQQQSHDKQNATKTRNNQQQSSKGEIHQGKRKQYKLVDMRLSSDDSLKFEFSRPKQTKNKRDLNRSTKTADGTKNAEQSKQNVLSYFKRIPAKDVVKKENESAPSTENNNQETEEIFPLAGPGIEWYKEKGVNAVTNISKAAPTLIFEQGNDMEVSKYVAPCLVTGSIRENIDVLIMKLGNAGSKRQQQHFEAIISVGNYLTENGPLVQT